MFYMKATWFDKGLKKGEPEPKRETFEEKRARGVKWAQISDDEEDSDNQEIVEARKKASVMKDAVKKRTFTQSRSTKLIMKKKKEHVQNHPPPPTKEVKAATDAYEPSLVDFFEVKLEICEQKLKEMAFTCTELEAELEYTKLEVGDVKQELENTQIELKDTKEKLEKAKQLLRFSAIALKKKC